MKVTYNVTFRVEEVAFKSNITTIVREKFTVGYFRVKIVHGKIFLSLLAQI